MPPRDVALATLPPLLWAIAYTVAKPATAAFPPLLLISMAYAVTAFVLLTPWRPLRTPLWAVVVAGTFGASLQSALIFSGIAQIPASMAILVVQSQVPFAVLSVWAIGQEKIQIRRLAGIVLALAGVAMVVGLPDAAGNIRGSLLVVLGTVSWGIAQAVVRTFSRDSGARLMGAMSAVATPQLLAASFFLEKGQVEALTTASVTDWFAFVVLAFGGFAGAYAIWYSLLLRYRVDQVAPFVLLMPVIGVLSSWILLDERPTLPTIGGGLVILAGLAMVVVVSDAALRPKN